MGDQAQDGQEPTQASVKSAGGMVSQESSSTASPNGTQTLKQKLQGHYGYYGIIGNFPSLLEFREGVRKFWKYWLSRRRRGDR